MKQKWSPCTTAVIITFQQPQASIHRGLVFSVWKERPESQRHCGKINGSYWRAGFIRSARIMHLKRGERQLGVS